MPSEAHDDPSLRAELRALYEATPPPRAGFTDAVMHQVALRPRPRRSFVAALLAGRTITLRFSVAQLLGVAVAAAFIGAIGLRASHPARQAPIQTVTAEPAAGDGDVLVRFALPAKDARGVSVAGDFNGWRPDATPLERGADGIFRATIRLSPGTWSYSFVVDGKWVEDPFAESYRADGFGGRNALVHIGG